MPAAPSEMKAGAGGAMSLGLHRVRASLRALTKGLERLPPLGVALGLFLVLALLSLPLSNRLYSNGLVDIGEYLNNPLRLLRGELPYRDFWLFHPPGEVLLPFLVYRFFGLNVEYVLLASVFLNVSTAVLSFLLAHRIVEHNGLAALIALLVYFDGVATEGGMAVSLQTGHYLVFAVAAVLAFTDFLRTSRWISLPLSGFAMGCAFSLRLYDTAPAALACLVALIAHPAVPGGRRGAAAERVRRVSLFFAGLAVSWAVVILTWLPVWDPAIGVPMSRELFVGSIQYYAQTFHDARPWTFLADQAAHVIERSRAALSSGGMSNVLKLGFRLQALVNCLALYAFPFAAVGLAVRLIRRGVMPVWQRTLFVLLGCWGLLSLGKVWKSMVLYYWMAGTTPLFFMWGLILRRLPVQGGAWARRLAWGLTAVLCMAVPVGAGLTAFRLSTIRSPIVSPHGTILVEDAAYARGANRLVALIGAWTRDGDAIFVEPLHIPPLYAMMNRRNPSAYDSLQIPYVRRLAGLPTDRVEARVCEELSAVDTRLVLTEESSIRTMPVLRGCIEEGLTLRERVGPYTIYAGRRGAEAETSGRRPET